MQYVGVARRCWWAVLFCSCCSRQYAVWYVHIIRWWCVIVNWDLFHPSFILLAAQLLRAYIYEEPF